MLPTKIRTILCSTILLIAGTTIACSNTWAQTPDVLFEQISPSIWSVLTYDPNGRPLRQGSAVVIATGKLVTNCHVLTRARTVDIAKDNVKYRASLEFADTQRDLCQIQVRNFTAPAVKTGAVKDLRVGQRVYAIGSPKGLELTMSDGIISSLRSTSTDDQPLIQTTAAISAGSSGGGLFSSEGLLIGITTFVVKDSQNLNFAHPADWIADIPERAKLQMAQFQAAKSTQNNTGSTAARDGTPLAGAELGTLIRSRSFRVSSGPSDLEKITFNANGYVDLSFSIGLTRAYSGTYTLQTSEGRLCMHFFITSLPMHVPIRPFNGCFAATRIGERQVRFRADDNTEFVTEG